MLSEKVKENQKGLKFSGTHQLLLYPDDVNLFEVKDESLNRRQ
jgi:hypothetical protein